MSKNKSRKDIISEQEFNLRMMGSNSTPGEDSPGDSESDAGSEFLMGLNYMPDEKLDGEKDDVGEKVYSDEKSTSSGELPNASKTSIVKPRSKAEKAGVVSSELPSPWSDLDSESDTH